jgi:hypothetical protein
VGQQRATKAAVAESHKRLLAEVAGLAAHIQDPKGLKEQVRRRCCHCKYPIWMCAMIKHHSRPAKRYTHF